jgi:predicted cobalt transporter CbtA
MDAIGDFSLRYRWWLATVALAGYGYALFFLPS